MTTSDMAHAHPSWGGRVLHEFVQYAIVCAYLYVCFGAIILYKAAILHAQGIEYSPYGIALVKALILGKFMLIGDAIKIGGDGAERRLAVHILYKAVLLLLVLLVLTAIEEGVVAYIHGRSVLAAVVGLGGGTLQQTLAASLIVFLILIPYIAFREISLNLGEGAFVQMLTQRRSPSAGAAAE
jgi:hypothetical protein